MKKFDISFTNKIPPKKGRVLISDPFQGDEYFERSVVYLCEHSRSGSFGFVLNNYIDINLQSLNEQFPNLETRISVGGPVETETMFFMHTLGDQLNDSLLLAHGIYMGGDFEQLYTFLQQEHLDKHQLRFFLGYSGWSKGQLEEEIASNAWVVAEIDDALEIMQANDDCWKTFMTKMGPSYKLMTSFPIDPTEN